MGNIKGAPYLVWRNGRPRWVPGEAVRKLGFCGCDLKDDAGRWLREGEAVRAAERLNQEVDAYRKAAGGEGPRRPPPKPRQVRTVRDLYDRWVGSPRYVKLAENTRYDYESKMKVFLDEFGDEPLGAIAHHHLYQWWENIFRERGHTMANGIIAVARAMFSYAAKIGWRSDNPARALGLQTLKPRVVVWTDSEVATFIDIGDALSLTLCVDAVIIALHTSQRQGDVLLLEEDRVENGRARFRQSKTKARVSVPLTDQLAARLEAIKTRRRAQHNVIDLALAKRLLLRNDGRAYDEWILRREFIRIREYVALVHPTFAGKQFLDLRDTAITRLALAGCSVAEIRAISGHSLETIHQVLKHYIALDDRMAVSAIDRLKHWMQEEGIAI